MISEKKRQGIVLTLTIAMLFVVMSALSILTPNADEHLERLLIIAVCTIAGYLMAQSER